MDNNKSAGPISGPFSSRVVQQHHHPLHPTTPSRVQTAICDVCRSSHSSAFFCSECNFDICEGCINSYRHQLNRAGVAMIPGADGSGRLYCGRWLGVKAIPGSDGQCGPTNGPQCADCQNPSDLYPAHAENKNPLLHESVQNAAMNSLMEELKVFHQNTIKWKKPKTGESCSHMHVEWWGDKFMCSGCCQELI